jgi:hypothetical protein
MLRSVIAVIVSYIVLNILIAGLFVAAMFALGIEGTLRPGEYWTSSAFNAAVLLGGAAAAALAGALCAVIARSWRPAVVVAAVMLAFGLFGAFRNSQKPDPPARGPAADGESSMDYTMRVLKDMRTVGKEPTWFSFGVPFIGAAAFLVGARVVAARRRPAP